MLIILATIAIQQPRVQTQIVKFIASQLESRLHTKVSIESVNIKLFKSLKLYGIYIEDQRNDTLLYAKSLTAGISLFDLGRRQITVNDIELNSARIKLKHFKDVKGLNLDFIIDEFSSIDTSASKPWDIKLEHIKLNENTFSFTDERYNDYTPCVDFDDIFLTHLNIDVDDFKPYKDSLYVNISNISCLDKSGFRLSHFAAETLLSGRLMRFNNLKIQTPQSDLSLNYQMAFDSISDFDDYENKVLMRAEINKSKLSSNDLQYFSRDLFGFNKALTIAGSAKGTVSLLKAKNLDIKYGVLTHFRGDVIMNGLPDFDKTYLDLNIDDFKTSKEDIESIPTFPFTEKQKIKLPDNIAVLGTCRFKGKFTGFYNDFVAYGNATTAIGDITSDINLKTGGRTEEYSGHISSRDFDIGKLTGSSDALGNITMSATVKGEGFTSDNLVTKVEGTVSSVFINKYTYKNITVNGEVSHKLFRGALAVDENNIKMKFDGSVDYRNHQPVFNCNASIENINLARLNLVNRDSSSSLSADVQMNLSGDDLDNAYGTVKISDLVYSESGQAFKINTLNFNSSLVDKVKHLDVFSDYADVSVYGINRISTIVKSIQQVVKLYFPVAAPAMTSVVENESGTFKINIKDINPLLGVFYSDLKVAPNSLIEGDLNTLTNQLHLRAQSADVVLHGVELNELTLSGLSAGPQFTTTIKSARLLLNDSLSVSDFEIGAVSTHDSASLRLSARDVDTSHVYVRLGATAYFRNDSSSLHFLPESIIIIDGSSWHFSNHNEINFQSGVAFENFNLFKNSNESLQIAGKTAGAEKNVLLLTFQNFELAPLNNIFRTYDFEVGGIINGTANYTVENDRPLINADLSIAGFSFFGDTLGRAVIKSNFDTEKNRIVADATFSGGTARNVNINGYYQIGKGKAPDELHFDGQLEHTNLSLFQHYFEGLASDMHGMVTANVQLRGTSKEPLLTGKAQLQKANFTVDYLNTHYSFTDEITFNEKNISFNNISLTDRYGNIAKLNGRILHDHLENFRPDIHLTPVNFMVLSTNASQNDLFYGTAFATGKIDIGGTFSNINMDVKLTSDKNTTINLPLSSPEEVGENGFITFVKHDTAVQQAVIKRAELTGMNIDMELTVNTEAVIKIIFDSKIGDVITGTGNGDLRMTVKNDGSFNLFGNYIINEGSYYFTMQNVLGKYFVLEKGGSIRWNGDPYEGIIDLSATYTRNAGLYDLLQDTSAQYKKKVPVEAVLNLKNKLFNPDITFDINVPDVDATTASLIKRYISTEEEKNKQAMSLIVLGRFSAPGALEGGSTINSNANVAASLSEFVTHQLSNWASQISSNFNVDFNYTPGDIITRDQFDATFSTSLLKNRIKVSGTVGYGNDVSTNSTNIVGDFNVEADVSKDGRFKVKAFNKSNNNTLLNPYNAPYTQGVGWFYRQEFDKLGDLFRRKDKTSKTDSTGVQ